MWQNSESALISRAKKLIEARIMLAVCNNDCRTKLFEAVAALNVALYYLGEHDQSGKAADKT